MSEALILMAHLVDKFGVHIVLDKLREIGSCPDPQKDLENYIIEVSCIAFDVRPNEILTTRHLSNDATPARDMVIVLLHQYLKSYSVKKIAGICKKPSSTVSRTTRAFQNMNPRIKHEREFLEVHGELTEKINHYLNQQNVENE